MKLRRFGAVPENQPIEKETQRTCPNCGSLVSTRAKTCVHCGEDLAALAAKEQRAQQLAQQEQSEEAAQRPVRAIAIGVTVIIALIIIGIVIQSSREAAILALTPTVTRTPTRTPTTTITPTPTPTSAATSTPIPPFKYTVKSGDTPGAIADFYDLGVDELMAYNKRSVGDFIVVGETLLIPVPTPKPTGTATPIGFVASPTGPAVTPSEIVYTVKSGDTLGGIALSVGVPIDVIQRRNNIEDPESIQIGQQLIIPTGPTPTFTPAPIPAEATATPRPTYAPVAALSPLDGEIIIGNSPPILLEWLSSGLLREDEYYRAEVAQVQGLLTQSIRTRATSWHVPIELFPTETDPNRLFKWKVEIIRQVGIGSDGQPVFAVVSTTNERVFEWLVVAPTPKPTATRLPGSNVTP
ncbi:MAG TPA: LysM peptidoglycan-binding domain-containing protein [Anaerolineae bacterium]|nr:LysM peptidoglycan-binding domain-containing protein [Anaerolineae bacterium]